jgi:hypothetical protein
VGGKKGRRIVTREDKEERELERCEVRYGGVVVVAYICFWWYYVKCIYMVVLSCISISMVKTIYSTTSPQYYTLYTSTTVHHIHCLDRTPAEVDGALQRCRDATPARPHPPWLYGVCKAVVRCHNVVWVLR